ncbi:inositol monophosphatase family protein [soil metagenome]
MPANDPRSRRDIAPEALRDIAAELAVGAGELIRDGRRTASRVTTSKSSPTDVVGEMDHASEAFLSAELARLRPDDGLLGEEGSSRTGTTGLCWIVDPIDGTVNYLYGIPAYAVSVAAEVDGVVIAGAVCNPETGELFSAWLGGGAWLGPHRLSGSRPDSLSIALVSTGFSYDAVRRGEQALVAAALLPRVRDLRRIGSAALDLCQVAAGRLDAHYEQDLHRWDFAAGALIAAEAGAVVTGAGGRPADERLVIAAAPTIAGALCALLDQLLST